jgi:nucleoside-diphosphate-sugar epimerase
MDERILITGGQGFIGAWIARRLALDGSAVTLFDLKEDDHILGQVLEADLLGRIERSYGDIADCETVTRVAGEARPTAVIHLAGLQVPACRQNPTLGARVNVIGTLSVFEAVKALPEPVNIVYASSAAVVGRPEDYSGPVRDDARHEPRTHYGVFKMANEGSARVYWHDHGIPSVGLRPYTVYGVGREVGVTSAPTKAIKAAVLDRDYTIGFGGATLFDYVEDVADYFIAAARARLEGASAFNIRGQALEMAEFPAVVDEALPGARRRIKVEGDPLPLAVDLDDTGLREMVGDVRRTPLVEGVRRTVERFQRLRAEGRLYEGDLG